MNSLLTTKQPVHFIGVGGIGMSALAMILSKRGYFVTGSDQKSNSQLNRLSEHGIKVFKQQIPTNIQTISRNSFCKPLIVISTAIPEHNPELRAAREANLKIIHRSDILAELIKNQPSIVVAGSHGKTTTSTFITTLLAQANQDPTAVIGGLVPCYNSNSHIGLGELLIAEADESDGSLVKFQSDLGIITNLELDHIDHYKDLNELANTMKKFSKNCKVLLANHDCPNVQKKIKASAWWSIEKSEGVDFAAIPIKVNGQQTIADIYEKGLKIGQITLPIPGLHNLSNAISAIAACRLKGIPYEILEKNISYLKTPGRRFEFRGIWKGRQVFDDYAHHPSEVNATLKMARLIIESSKSKLNNQPKRLVTVFEPHRYSRVHQFLKEFALALSESDLILLAPIYSAGEKIIDGINSECLANYIKGIHPDIPVFTAQNFKELPLLVETYTKQNDLIITMGAGDINQLWAALNANKPRVLWQATRLAA